MHRLPPFLTVCLLLVLAVAAPFSMAAEENDNSDLKSAFAALEGQGPFEEVVSLDWGLAETLLAIGHTPAGVAETEGYRQWVGDPPLPDSVTDIGRRTAPNLELLSQMQPDLILSTIQFRSIHHQLEQIAPVLELSIYAPGGDPLERARVITRGLGRLLDREDNAEALIARLDRTLQQSREALRQEPSSRPVILLNLQDHRHARVAGEHSLYDAVLDELGLENAWNGPTNFWGTGVLSIDRLVDYPRARIVLIDPTPRRVLGILQESPLWQNLPAIENQRWERIDPAWGYGGVYAATRFARLLTQALTGAPQ